MLPKIIMTPIATNAAPAMRLKRGVVESFSIVISTPSAAIQTTFMVPTENITSIIAQQQPRQ